MNYLFFDVETNGLPRNWKAPMKDLDNWPRVISLAFILVSETGLPLMEKHSLIKPDGWIMPEADFWKENGFSQEKSMEEGIPISEVLAEFVLAVNQADVMIAHNMNFDYNVIGSELIRNNLRADKKPEKVCTMESTTQLLQLPGRFGFKFPKLQELYSFLFNKEFDGAHDALVDVRACADCFFELLNTGKIQLTTSN